MNISLLLSELRVSPLENVSGERLAAYADLCETFCEWYSVFGLDGEIPLSGLECRECLAILFSACRKRFGLAKRRAVRLCILIHMCRLSRWARMLGNDAASRFYEHSVDHFFTMWENTGFPRLDKYEEELDLLTLIYEDRREIGNSFLPDNVCKYYADRQTEILSSLLSSSPDSAGCGDLAHLRSILLLTKSRGCCLDLHRDAEIRELYQRYINNIPQKMGRLEVHLQESMRSGDGLQHLLCCLRVLQELFEVSRGWYDDALYDRFATMSGQWLSRLPLQTDAWWQGRSILLRQHLVECYV